MKIKLLLLVGLVALIVGVRQLPTSTQAQIDPNVINLGERKVGQINASNPQPTYVFNAAANQSVEIDITTLTSQLAVSFTVLNDSGALVVAVGNPTQVNQISDSVTFPATGAYSIQISNVSSVDGDFIISILPPESAVPATPLLAGQTQQNSLAQGAEVYYGITTNSETPLYLDVTIDNPTVGLDITLSDNNGEALAFVKNILLGVRLLLPAGVEDYDLVIANLHPDGISVGFTVSLTTTPLNEQLTSTSTPTPVVGSTPTATPGGNELPELPTSGPCKLATQGQIVNVREGPSVDYDIVATIGAFTIYDVLGRNEDSSWLQIDAQPEIGWVAWNVTRHGGDCDLGDLSLVSYPPLLSSISGTVWHDLCAPPPVLPSEPPTGCIDDAIEGLIANGLFEAGEVGIENVEVTLGLGACPATILGSRLTNSAGQYFYNDLEAGTYCLSINALSVTNSAVLIPGLWTAPRTDTLASFTINLDAGDDRVINFGWDFQFAP